MHFVSVMRAVYYYHYIIHFNQGFLNTTEKRITLILFSTMKVIKGRSDRKTFGPEPLVPPAPTASIAVK